MTLLAWHFSAADKKLGNDDGRLIRKGRTLKVDCAPVLCRQGLHASVRVIDALKYAPGPHLWRVKLGGTIVRGDDKVVATERTALWGFDATPMLWHFARLCALDVVHLWDCPDVVKRFLESGDESLRAAARDAARDAAWDAARDFAWAAARDFARDAAGDAARDAAGAAAWDAAGDAARDAAGAAAGAAAWDAAWDAQQKHLLKLIRRYAKAGAA